MKKMDEEGLRLSALQAEVFEKSYDGAECSSPVFLRRFMNSQVASRMDREGFLLEASDADSILEEIIMEYGPTAYGTEKYGREELYWMGYLYRYWAYTCEKSSRQLYKMMKPKELRKLYFPYHSLDPAQAIERILEGFGSVTEDRVEEDYTKRGVQILRKMIERDKTATKS